MLVLLEPIFQCRNFLLWGNNGTTDANATGTVNVAGSLVTISVSSAGAGYTSSPALCQVVEDGVP